MTPSREEVGRWTCSLGAATNVVFATLNFALGYAGWAVFFTAMTLAWLLVRHFYFPKEN